MEVDARLVPLALNRPFRCAAHGGDLRERKAAEEAQIDNLGEPRLARREIVERVADPLELPRVRNGTIVASSTFGMIPPTSSGS